MTLYGISRLNERACAAYRKTFCLIRAKFKWFLHYIRNYYPRDTCENNRCELYEYPNYDLIDGLDEQNITDFDYGIADGTNNLWTISGDQTRSERFVYLSPDDSTGGYLFWERRDGVGRNPGVQDVNTTSPEVTFNSFGPLGALLNHLFSDPFYAVGRPYGIFGAPHCAGYTVGSAMPSTCQIVHDDVAVNIR